MPSAHKFQRTERGAEPVEDMEMYSDEDLEGGFEDVEDAEDDVVDAEPEDVTERVPSTSSHYAIPSNEEIHGLKETSDLYMNNVFKLQLDEMRKHMPPSATHKPAMDDFLRHVQQRLVAIEAVEPQPLSAAIRTLERRVGCRVHVPFAEPVPRGDPAYAIGFEAPRTLHLVGSWPLQTAVRRPGDMDVDVEAVMPSTLFQEKDTLNARYFTKRAFYLAVLAAHLRQEKHDVSYAFVGGDRRRACVVLRPKALSKLRAVVRIHLAHEPGLFPVARLAPDRNNLRGAAVGASEQDTHSLPPTPMYNACIAADSLRLAHLVYLNATSEMCAGFREACQLLKIWAAQRGFGALLLHGDAKHVARRTLAGTDDARFVLSMLLAHLLHGDPKGSRTRTSKLSAGMSSVQLFRGVLEFLARHSFSTPVWMKAQPRFGLAASELAPAAFAVCERVLVEPSGCVNLLAHWPASSVDMLQHEAMQSMHMLSDGDDHFADLFLVPHDVPLQRFDEVATLRLVKTTTPPVPCMDAGHAALWAVHRTLQVSAQALGQRAWCVAICTPTSVVHPIDGPLDQPPVVELGVGLRAEHAWHQVEHGPPPQSDDAPTFRAFWGDVAELRRFRDGRVLESVVWPVASLAQRYALPRRILRHALTHHVCAKRIRFAGDALATGYTDIPGALASRAYAQDPGVHGFQLVLSAYDTLARELRAMDELPLSVIGVSPTSAALRHMSVFAPGPIRLAELGHDVPDVASYLPVHDVLITLESSGQWPDDLAAIQAMKAALYERMADVLVRRIPGAYARVVYDDDMARDREAIHDHVALQLVLPAGFAFSLRIHHDREQVLLHRLLSDAHVRPRAQAALTRYDTRFVHAPAHHAALSALQDRHAALAPTVRLVRRWFGAQLLLGHVGPETLDLLCAAVFLTNAHAVPATGLHGFVRVLTLLAHWDWREVPLLLPLENATRLAHQRKAALSDGGVSALPSERAPTFPAAQRADAEQHFRAMRARDPAYRHYTWVVATEHDTDAKAWMHAAPSAMVADGVRQLARRAALALEQDALHAMPALFAPAYDAYDFVVHIRPSVHVRYAEALAPEARHWLEPKRKKYANDEVLRPSVYGSELRPGFDPVGAFVRMLKTLYGDTFTLFYDEFGGTAIGGLWNAAYTKPHAFKVWLAHSARPHAKDAVVLNKPAILAEIKRLGQGIVERIDTI